MMPTNTRVFVTKQLDKPVYKTLQTLRVIHGDLGQWEILQAAIITFASLAPEVRLGFLTQVQRAPSDQPEIYPIAGA